MKLLPYAVALLGVLILSLVFDPISLVAGIAVGSMTREWIVQNASHGKRGGL